LLADENTGYSRPRGPLKTEQIVNFVDEAHAAEIWPIDIAKAVEPSRKSANLLLYSRWRRIGQNRGMMTSARNLLCHVRLGRVRPAVSHRLACSLRCGRRMALGFA
jgi:hypothetical protein